MNYPTVTYQDLLWRLARDASLNPDVSAGTVTMTTLDAHRLTNWLNEGLALVWNYFEWVSLPQTMESRSVTLAAGAVIEASEIDDGDRWSIWESDPRLADERLEELRMTGVRLNNGDVRVINASAGDSVYVFWQTPVPVWSYASPSVGTVAQALSRAVLLFANAERMENDGSLPVAASRFRQRAEQEMERLLMSQMSDGTAPGWMVHDTREVMR
jgi:hypothetical protein